MDDKTQAAVAKLLSPAGKDVRTVRVPRAETGAHAAHAAGTAAAGHASAWPLGTPQTMSEQLLQQLAARAAGAAGWSEYTTPEGKKYYHHAASQATQWDPPPGWGQPSVVPQPQFDAVHLRPVLQGKETALLDKILPHLATQRPAPCAVLARDVRVAVGYWHRDGIESKARLDALLASVARKVVLDLVVACLKHHLAEPSAAAAGNASAAAASLSASNDPKAWLLGVKEPSPEAEATLHTGVKGGERLTLKAVRGEEGVLGAEAVVSDEVWARAGRRQDVCVVPMVQGGRQERYMVVEEPELLADIARLRAERALREARHAEWVRQQQQVRLQEQAQARALPPTLDAGLGMLDERVLLQLQQIQQLCTLQQQLQPAPAGGATSQQQQQALSLQQQAALWQLQFPSSAAAFVKREADP